ncbi:MAG TPA: outer membrane lipoprotein carrier protein LolA [Candidatus Angelobacter sp.]|nr:outer membrane lipoprotein carrier protein LolA [Candidatus Angelobacter sp.]
MNLPRIFLLVLLIPVFRGPAAPIYAITGLQAVPAQTNPAGDITALASAVDERYDHLKTFQADFKETYHSAGIARSESGVLWLKKPGKMRWEYRQPREKLFISDSHTAFFYVSGERQARRTPIKNLDDVRSPLRYLLGKTKLEKELEGLSFAADVTPLRPGNVVLRGQPRGMKERISEVLLDVSPKHQIERIVIEEVGGASTDFQFSNLQEDVSVQESLFHFSPPPGVGIIESRELAQ